MLTRKSPISVGSAPVKGESLTAQALAKRSGGVSFRFKREEHLKGRKEIREVFDKGKRIGCQGAKLFILKNDLPYNRICFTFSRGFGNAIVRNRAKRLGREAFRLMKERFSCGHDLILLIYPESGMTLSGRAGQLEFLFSKAGLLK